MPLKYLRMRNLYIAEYDVDGTFSLPKGFSIADTVHFPFTLCGHFLDGLFLEWDMSFSELVFV